MKPIDQVSPGGNRMYFCGIDWAENHLDFCLENYSGDVIERNRITGFIRFKEKEAEVSG